MAEEENQWQKLPTDEKCVHKVWKARVEGYEEAAKLFRTIDEEKGPEWNKYLGLVKKFVTDSNAVAQEKGLEAALAFVENCGHAGKTVGEVISSIVTKCMGATRAKTKDLAVQITLMYIEIERHEIVLEELLKGTDQKNPKIVATCVSTMTQALREFGTKVVSVKPIVKKLQVMLSDRDKTVRDESKSLTVEMYRWIGPAFKTQIASLPQVMLTELDTEFEKVKPNSAVPTRYLRSQQEKAAAVAAAAANAEDVDEGDEEQEGAIEMDPLDLVDPVDILSQIPKDFYEKLESKKWQERKESLEALESLVQHPKLLPGDYGDLVRALKKVITKDTNVVLVALAGKCMANLARGLAKKFQPYGVACVQGILEKFKEKKQNVVTALRDAIDAIYPSINLEVIQEDVLEALNSKNPSVKAETASFVARALTVTQPTALNKKLLKTYITALLKNLNDSDLVVRDSAADALGTALKLMGEKAIAPFLTDVDALKQAKIKEFSDKAVINIKIAGAKKERPATAPAKQATAAPQKGGSTEPKPVTRPQTAAGRKPAAKKAAPAAAAAVSKSASSKALPTEQDLSPEEIDERAGEILPADVVAGLVDSDWKTRLAAAESFSGALGGFDAKCGHSQVLVRILAKKPGLKENNFQVLKLRLELVKDICEKFGLTSTTAEYIINDVTEKLGDPKNNVTAAATLMAITEATRLEYVVNKMMTFAFEQKSPKVQQEVLKWVNNSIREFGFQVNGKQLLEDTRKAVQSVNPAVRANAITLLGTMHLYMGNNLTMFFENEKTALKQQIFAEFEKNAGQKAPPPSRGVSHSSSKASMGEDEEPEDDQEEPVAVSDLFPRVDISVHITDALLTEISDKNWKTRNEGLEKFKNILCEARLIKSNLGDLPQNLAQRLVDSNAKIALTAFEICEKIATAMGPPCKQYVTVFFPGFFKGLGDSKTYIRTAGISCMNVWCEQCGYKEVFSGEMVADALKVGSPVLRTELLGWLAEKLPNIPTKTIQKEELVACLPHLYASLIDRNADVRKNANETVLGIMIHIGYEAMMKVCEKQKPASKKDIQAALDKARPNLPVKPLPKGKQQAPIPEEPTTKTVVKGGRVQKVVVNKPAAVSRKKEEEVDLSPLLAINNLKQQRFLDEQKLKVLKWNFTTPREEFIDLLKDQMSSANMNKGLMANMYHDDFRYHIKAIESLIEDIHENPRGLESNLDLILKWISLRFYDTNTSVLLKGLEYLNLAFSHLVEIKYKLTELEGNSFIPHLLIKIGDSKDAVRNGVRSVLRQIYDVYQNHKVFGHIMEALKSKNARQRAECLDELGCLIEMFGILVCQPTPNVALKEIAKSISDRDNSVRNAALNCIVQAYFILNEKVYKMIGQISEKDMSMLDERIKRTKRPVKKVEVVKPAPTPVEPVEVIEELTVEEELPSESDVPPPVQQTFTSDVDFANTVDETVVLQQEPFSDETYPICSTPRIKLNFDLSIIETPKFELPPKPTGPFKLDQNFINEIERNWVRVDERPKVRFDPIDMSSIHTPLKSDGVYPASKLQYLMERRSPHNRNNAQCNVSPIASGGGHYRPATAPTPQRVSASIIRTPSHCDPTFMKLITNIGSDDKMIAQAALIEISDVLDNKDKQAVLRGYETYFIESILQQFKHLSQQPINDALVMYQPLLHVTYAFFLAPLLGKSLSDSSIKQLMSVLLNLMADNKLESVEDPQYLKVVNGICLKVLDATNFTHLNCALIRLLKETCSASALPKFTELLMKCIWRNVKVLPDRVEELDFEAVLFEINQFLMTLPSTWWGTRPSDTPLRTIRTIIHNMTRIKGQAILVHVTKIEACSELHHYVLKVLKKEQMVSIDTNTYTKDASSREKRLSITLKEQARAIFKLIAERETSQEGLNKLYDLRRENPEFEVDSLIVGSADTFRKYILDGLENIKHEREAAGEEPVAVKLNKTMTPSAMNNSPQPDQWMERLKYLKQMANLSPGAGGDSNNAHIDNRIADENLNTHHFKTTTNSTASNDMNDRKGLLSGVHNTVTTARLQSLQEKLAQLKQNQQ